MGFGKNSERWSSSLGLVIMGGVTAQAGSGEAARKPRMSEGG